MNNRGISKTERQQYTQKIKPKYNEPQQNAIILKQKNEEKKEQTNKKDNSMPKTKQVTKIATKPHSFIDNSMPKR